MDKFVPINLSCKGKGCSNTETIDVMIYDDICGDYDDPFVRNFVRCNAQWKTNSNISLPEECDSRFFKFHEGCKYWINFTDSSHEVTAELIIPQGLCESFKFQVEKMTVEVNEVDDVISIESVVSFNDTLLITGIDLSILDDKSQNVNLTSKNFDNYTIVNINQSTNGLNKGATYVLKLNYNNHLECNTTVSKTFRIGPMESTVNSIIIILLVSALVIIIFIAMGCKSNRRKISITMSKSQTRLEQIIQRNKTSNECSELIEHVGNVAPFLSPKISLNNLQIIKEIGKGAFGNVYLAKPVDVSSLTSYNYVAVKVCNFESALETENFQSEFEMLQKIRDHTHILKLLGYCTESSRLYIVTEFIPCGDLKEHLIGLRQQWTRRESKSCIGEYIGGPESLRAGSSLSSQYSSSPEDFKYSLNDQLTPLKESEFPYIVEFILDHNELQRFALQIARGMAHLEKLSIRHGDLAARNILINEFKMLKISDFGHARYIESGHETSCTPTTKIAVRWAALEILKQGRYNLRNDVWSFAVVLWEIGTLGAHPYSEVPRAEEILDHLIAGNRLYKPPVCSDNLYDLMTRCWSAELIERPSFHDLIDLLDVQRQLCYVDFQFLNPTYLFPPVKDTDT